MYLYIFLSIIIICITFIICFILSNFTEISDYREYKNDHYELKRLRDEYNENITKYQIQVESICNSVNNFNNFIKKYKDLSTNFLCLYVDVKNILAYNIKDSEKIEQLIKLVNHFKL